MRNGSPSLGKQLRRSKKVIKLKELLIFTAASGLYCDYMPLWRWCISKAYQEYDCFCVIIQNPTTRYYAAIYRLLHHPSPDFKYIYVTDVDMMILREKPTLMDFHLREMKKTGLCYSNSKRYSEPQGDRRMTGLHFCNQRWYRKTQSQRDIYIHMLENGEICNNRFDDELILMKVMNDSKIEISPRFVSLVLRHHGIHMGTLRSYKSHTRQKLNEQLRMRITPDQARQWLKYYEDGEFCAIMKATCTVSKILKWEYEALYSYCMRRAKE
jgi:hypothetical protein